MLYKPISTLTAPETPFTLCGVNWFSYVKFYIDSRKRIRPLVVGKSGSLNVNSGGSDVSFSTDGNDGPARKFLMDECATWDKTQILVIKAKSEKQALFLKIGLLIYLIFLKVNINIKIF